MRRVTVPVVIRQEVASAVTVLVRNMCPQARSGGPLSEIQFFGFVSETSAGMAPAVCDFTAGCEITFVAAASPRSAASHRDQDGCVASTESAAEAVRASSESEREVSTTGTLAPKISPAQSPPPM